MAVGVGLLGIAIAYLFYKKQSNYPDKVAKAAGSLYQWSYDKFYFDELYMFVTKQIIFKRISAPFAWFDKNIVDGTMNLIGNSMVRTSDKIKGLQSGKIQDYAYDFVVGAVILVMIMIYNFM